MATEQITQHSACLYLFWKSLLCFNLWVNLSETNCGRPHMVLVESHGDLWYGLLNAVACQQQFGQCQTGNHYWCSMTATNPKNKITAAPIHQNWFPLKTFNVESVKDNHLLKYQPTSQFSVSWKKLKVWPSSRLCFCFAGPAPSGERRSLGMQLAADAAKRRRCSMTWLTSCLYPTASALTWTRPPSWGWLSASCAHTSCSPQVRTLYHTHIHKVHRIWRTWVCDMTDVCVGVYDWLLGGKVFVGPFLCTPSSRLI